MTFSKKRLNSLDVFKYSLGKPHNTGTTQLVNSIVFKSSFCIGGSEPISKKEFYDLLVWSSILYLI